jgi:hypothetical protein
MNCSPAYLTFQTGHIGSLDSSRETGSPQQFSLHKNKVSVTENFRSRRKQTLADTLFIRAKCDVFGSNTNGFFIYIF